MNGAVRAQSEAILPATAAETAQFMPAIKKTGVIEWAIQTNAHSHDLTH